MVRPAEDTSAILGRAIESLTGKVPELGVIEKFQRYLSLLITWNRTHRLTGVLSDASIIRELFVDSMLFLQHLPPGPLTMVDIGTGPGIPGVPIRIVRPEIGLTLIESRRKQVSFLQSLKRELDLTNVVILEGRAEELVVDYPTMMNAFDVVVTRAVGLEILPTAAHYMRSEGLFISGGPPTPMKEKTPGPLHTQSVTVMHLGIRRSFLLGRFA